MPGLSATLEPKLTLQSPPPVAVTNPEPRYVPLAAPLPLSAWIPICRLGLPDRTRARLMVAPVTVMLDDAVKRAEPAFAPTTRLPEFPIAKLSPHDPSAMALVTAPIANNATHARTPARRP